MSTLFHLPFRVRVPTADVACEAAKEQARAEGWTVKTLVRVAQEANNVLDTVGVCQGYRVDFSAYFTRGAA